ncbi:hypothetical protein [Prevotella pallens]
MLGYGRDESAPTPGGMFVTNFVGERNTINNPSAALSQTVSSITANHKQHYRNPLEHIWQTVSSIIANHKQP